MTVSSSARLPGPMALLMETKRTMDGGADEADMLGGAFLEAETPAPMRADAFESVMREIDAIEARLGARAGPRAARVSARHFQEVVKLPGPLRSAALEALENGAWKFAGLGMATLPLVQEGGVKAELLRIEPGKGVPSHGHNGREFTLVLQGAFEDGHNRYERGDLCECGPDFVHRPKALPGEICFALAVTEAPPAFKNVLGVIQRLTRH